MFLEIKNLGLDYHTKTGVIRALDSLDLKIEQKEFVCILGASGCGKSSLLKIIAGFEKPTEGTALFKGEEITDISWNRGVVFQEPNLYEWLTVEKNINFGLRMRKEPKDVIEQKTEEILKIVDLQNFSKKHVYELSGGMKQRVGIARTLINEPELLLMDEPFSALDAITREKMQDFIRRIWADTKKTVFFVTHDLDEALVLATRIVMLTKRPGKVMYDVPVNFTNEILSEHSSEIKYTKKYYDERNRLLEMINL